MEGSNHDHNPQIQPDVMQGLVSADEPAGEDMPQHEQASAMVEAAQEHEEPGELQSPAIETPIVTTESMQQQEIEPSPVNHTPVNTEQLVAVADIMQALKNHEAQHSTPEIQQQVEQTVHQPNFLQKIGLMLKHLFTFWKKQSPEPVTG